MSKSYSSAAFLCSRIRAGSAVTAAVMPLIRDYDDTVDRRALRACVIALQDFERELEPELPPGDSMAEAYLTFLFERCASFEGRIFVAESEGRVAGFVCVLIRVPPEGPNEPRSPYAYVSDLVVLPEHRGQGMGSALLARAEAAARESGARRLDVDVLARNRTAHELYLDVGFRDVQVHLWKFL